MTDDERKVLDALFYTEEWTDYSMVVLPWDSLALLDFNCTISLVELYQYRISKQECLEKLIFQLKLDVDEVLRHIS